MWSTTSSSRPGPASVTPPGSRPSGARRPGSHSSIPLHGAGLDLAVQDVVHVALTGPRAHHQVLIYETYERVLVNAAPRSAPPAQDAR